MATKDIYKIFWGRQRCRRLQVVIVKQDFVVIIIIIVE